MFTKLRFLSLAVFVSTLSLMDCKTTKPASDTTPPTIRWSIIHQGESGGPKEAKTGDASITVETDETTMITCIAEDSEGVKWVTLQKEANYKCTGSNSFEDKTIGTPFKPHEVKGKPASNGQVDAQLFLITEITPDTYPCSGNAESLSTVTCQAENYFGKTTKATLTTKRLGFVDIK